MKTTIHENIFICTRKKMKKLWWKFEKNEKLIFFISYGFGRFFDALSVLLVDFKGV